MGKNVYFIGAVAFVIVVAIITMYSFHLQTKEKIHEEESVHVQTNKNTLSYELTALGLVPKQGELGAYGYGIITSAGTDAILVSTTHAGVLDSIHQKDTSDPVWHNHFVKLGPVNLCGEDPGVIDITWESPGDITVDGKTLKVLDAPSEFTGTHSLTKSKIAFTSGTDVQKVVKFQLEPIFEDEELRAVCVTDIQEVDYEVEE